MLYLAILFISNTEGFLGLVLRSGGESEVAGRCQEFAAFHHGIDLILIVHVIFRGEAGKGQVHLGRVATTLAGMCLVNDDGELMRFMLLSDFSNDIWEFLDGRHNDAFSVLNGFSEIAGMLSPHHGIFHLHKLLDGVADLLIKDAAVRYNKDGVNQRTAILFNTDQLMSQPCDGVRLAASCAMLNQVTLTDAIGTNIGQQLFNDIQLMITREYLFDRLLLCILVNFLDDLCVVLDNA